MSKPKPLPRPPVEIDRGWEHIIASIEEGVVAVDASGLVLLMNQAAEELTGCSLATSRRQHHSQVFHRNPWISELIEDIGRSHKGSIRAEGEIAGLWGKTAPVRASASPILDPDGRRSGAAVILQDLTLQRSLEADLHRAQSVAHLGAVVAGISHEIKNPLSGIRGAVQLLGAGLEPSARAQEYIHLVLREVDRLTQLLERLMRLGARGALEVSAVNIHRVVEHVLSLVEESARREEIRIVRFFDPSLPHVRGHEDSLIQVLLNLVQNALSALAALPPEASRQLRLATRMETSYHVAPSRAGEAGRARTRLLTVEVEDNGVGIPAEIQPNVFSPFFTTKPKGTGLGLAISHRIVTDHGGTIRFESAAGKTVFRVILPAWESS